MKVSDVIKNCFFKLGYGVSTDPSDAENLSSQERELVNVLLRAVENVHSEIVSTYFPNIVKENVVLVDGKLLFSELTQKKIVYPVSLKRGAETKKIKVYPAYIESDFSGDAVFEFCALPDVYAPDTELGDRVPEWLLSEGVVAEYAYANNLIDAGAQSEKKFREGLSRLKSHEFCGRYVKPRRWE